MEAPFNQLSPAEDERLALLLEEMGDALQIIGKIQRHGYASRNPLEPASWVNRALLEKELGHVAAALRLMIEAGDVAEANIKVRALDKIADVQRWLHHQ